VFPFRKILVPTDFSTASEWAFDDAVSIAETYDAEILILHIRMTWERHPSELRFPADPSMYEYAEQQELNRLRERARPTLKTRLVVKKAPDPGNEIARTAKEENADLVVISTHARHHVAHLFVGSTTMHVINNPPCPVLAIRYGTRKHGSLRKLLVPVHLKQTSRAALELANAIAARDGAEVILVAVCGDEEREETEALIARLGKGTIIRGSDIEREILRFATRVSADAIFLNMEETLGQRKIDMLRHAPTPVMIVPA
jgi:nucleotide-binding universal stress UspA family protein